MVDGVIASPSLRLIQPATSYQPTKGKPSHGPCPFSVGHAYRSQA